MYRKLEEAAFGLFCAAWPQIRDGCAPRVPQRAGAGTFHLARDLDAISEIELDHPYTGRQFLDILRARTFPPYAGAWYRDGGRRVNVRLQLECVDED